MPSAPRLVDGAARDQSGAMHIEHIDAPSPAIRAAISAAIDVYNDSRTGRPEPAERVAVLLRGPDGATLGGAWCALYYDWLHVDLLHLPEAARGQGFGTRVMRAVERAAVRRGCRGVWLDTATFQAPGFYRGLGFTPIGAIADYQQGHDRMWLLKRDIVDGPDDPGVHVVWEPDDADHALILDQLVAFNAQQAGPSESRLFGLAVRDVTEGPVIGGLWGRMSRQWLCVDLLALPEQARGRRIGTELMERAEAMVRRHGGRGVWLDTFSFQARPFYEKRGYRVFGEIPDYPAPHSRFLLAKRFAA